MSLRCAIMTTAICGLTIAGVFFWVFERRVYLTLSDEARAAAERCALELSVCHARNAPPCLPTVGPVEAPIPKDTP